MSSDELDIRGGGVIAVDTGCLRDAAARLDLAAGECDRIRERLVGATRILHDAGFSRSAPDWSAERTGERALLLASDLRGLADVYDIVELNIQLNMAVTAGDLELGAELRARLGEYARVAPAHSEAAKRLVMKWLDARDDGVIAQFGGGNLWGDAFGALFTRLPAGVPWQSAVGALAALIGPLIWRAMDDVGHGAVPSPVPLAGVAPPVNLLPMTMSPTRGAPVASVADAAERIPQGDGRVRVEKYTMPDGSRQFVVYVAGTASGADPNEAWDWESNIDLYTEQTAASYAATMAALAAAGAEPGDTVHAVGYSQGAAVASYVSAADTYESPMLMTFGNPVQLDVGEGTLSIAVRHADDPVSALARGGLAGAAGAEGSFVAERTTPGTVIDGEGVVDPHSIGNYTETARMLDDSTDPRMAAVREVITELGTATSVEVTVYAAQRATVIGPAPGPVLAPGPAPAPMLPWGD